MKILILYDSIFGNTEKIAQAIGDALKPDAEVILCRVADAKTEHLPGLDLVIAGSPTRSFRPTPAMRDFLKGLPKEALKGARVAAFDTRIPVAELNNTMLSGFVKVFGYAARPIADLLVKKGGTLILPPEWFIVEDTEGPLRQGELERAAAWARRLLAEITSL